VKYCRQYYPHQQFNKNMKKLKTLIFLVLTIIAGLGSYFIISDKLKAGDAVASGGLTVTYLGQPISGPIFDLHDTKPGDITIRELVIENSSNKNEDVYVCGVRTDGDLASPFLEGVLELTISQNGIDLYGGTTGTQTLTQFFIDSAEPDCMKLFNLNKNSSKTVVFEVVFPPSAGNEYQEKFVVFDLIFGIGPIPQLKINEVYYEVDEDHGLDSPKDRGIVDCCGKDVTILIKDNASGSVNQVKVSQIEACKIIQNSTVEGGVIIQQSGNTGGNSSTTAGGSVNTGSVFDIINVIIGGGSNFASCGKKLGQNDEWVEIYNPTDKEVSLKNWKLKDNSGQITTITANKKIPAHGFALISKSASTWVMWSEPSSATKVELGKNIGDGLGNDGDHILLLSPQGFEVDQVGWGDDAVVWDPAVQLVTLGSSIERLTPGFDNDVVTDWEEELSPSPGS